MSVNSGRIFSSPQSATINMMPLFTKISYICSRFIEFLFFGCQKVRKVPNGVLTRFLARSPGSTESWLESWLEFWLETWLESWLEFWLKTWLKSWLEVMARILARFLARVIARSHGSNPDFDVSRSGEWYPENSGPRKFMFRSRSRRRFEGVSKSRSLSFLCVSDYRIFWHAV